MAFLEGFKKNQHVAYETIRNGFKNNKLSHAFLLNGSAASPLKETAYLLARSYLCESKVDHVACGECLNCIRVDNGSYYDFIVLDGSKSTIKKEQIERIQDEFSKTALEATGKKVYIIHLVENSSSGAINSMLKFLEEPSDDVLAIITTQNLTKVLPTIVSRCQLIRIKDNSKEEIINRLVEMGYSNEDSEILSSITNNIEEIKRLYDNGNYLKIKDKVLDVLKHWRDNPKYLPYYAQQELNEIIYDKNSMDLFLSLFEIALKDIYRLQYGQETLIKDSINILETLANRFEDVNSKIKEVIIYRGNLDYNVNTALLMDSLLFKIR